MVARINGTGNTAVGVLLPSAPERRAVGKDQTVHTELAIVRRTPKSPP